MELKCKVEEVIFSDGSCLTVSEENWDTAMRLSELESEAQAAPLEDPRAQLFHSMFYPKLAACSSGDVPTEVEARQMPSAELDKWYAVVKRLNPQWFAVIDALTKEAQAAEKKRRHRKRPKSANGSKTS